MDLQMAARNVGLEELSALLERQHETKYDVVVPSTHLQYQAGEVVILEGATRLSDSGVEMTEAILRPTVQFEDHLAARLEIPRQYLRKMRDHRVDHGYGMLNTGLELLDENVNFWLTQSDRNWFVRGFRDLDPDDVGIARAFLSDRYNVIDHLDALFAVLNGVRDGGIPNVKIKGADLTEKRMRVKIEAPEVTAAAPRFLARYRPSGPRPSWEVPNPELISAGLVVSNSETGGAAFQIAPQITVLVCQNGMTRTEDALRKVHLGEKMDTGVISWSEETRRRNIDLIRAQARDAVQTFLSTDYVETVARQLDELGDVMLDRPMEAIDSVGKKLRYSEDERQSILELFVEGGDTRASGVVNAFTAYARDVDNPDRAAEIEEEAFEILKLAGGR